MTIIGVYSVWYFFIVKPFHSQAQVLTYQSLFLLAIAFCMIMAAGYIINDILDVDIDRTNKPEKLIVSKYISVPHSYSLYFVFNILGAGISIFLASYYSKYFMLVFLPCGVVGLFVYSKWLKKSFLVGNFLISILCTAVLWIPILGEWEVFYQNRNVIMPRLIWISIISFVLMLMREIVKDMEDLEGDEMFGAHTLPIKLGIQRTHIAINFLTIIAIGCLLYISISFRLFQNGTAVFLAVLVFALIFSHIYSKKLQIKKSIAFKSKMLKLLLAYGMIILPYALSNFRA